MRVFSPLVALWPATAHGKRRNNLATSALHQSVEDPIVSFFDPGFTGLRNDLLKAIYTDPATPPKIKLLLLVSRYSTGYLKIDTILRESFIVNETGMSRTSLYRAKLELVSEGRLIVRHTKFGKCIYSLPEQLQSLKAARTSPQRDVPPSHMRDACIKRANKEKDQHHEAPAQQRNDDENSISSSTSSNWRNTDDPGKVTAAVAAQEAVTLQEPITDQAIPQAVFTKEFRRPQAEHKGEPKPTSSLTRKLLAVGVNAFLARRLTQTHSQELIEAALARVSTSGTITNPAGYLVAELSRGGYEAAPVSPLVLAKERSENVHQLRKTERDRADQAREESNRERVLTPLQHYEALEALEKDKILRFLDKRADSEGFSRISHWNSDHPVYRGLLAEIIAQYFSGNKLERAAGE